MGLPLQSLKETDTEMYHQPLRLSVLIQAPAARVAEILSRNEHLQTLLDNGWIYLLVMDPEKGNEVLRYQKGMAWVAVPEEKKGETTRASKKNNDILQEVIA